MARGWIERVFVMKPGEFRLALLAAAQFFCLLCGYFMLRPLRETMGLQSGVDVLRQLVLATVLTMVVANVVYGFIASRVPRVVLVPGVYGWAIVCLGGFVAVLVASGGEPGVRTGYVFFVWLSVFNLFAVSVFWSLMADVFTLEQGKRLFGFIGVGGTAGAIAGLSLVWKWAPVLGTLGLVSIASVLVAASGTIAVVMSRWASERGSEGNPVEGKSWSGLTHLLGSRYLSAIGAVVLIYTVLSTLLYFEKARIIAATVESDADRTAVFAAIEWWAQVLTILIQVFLTGRLMKWLGVGVLLAVVPAVSVVGFATLGLVPSLAVVAVFEAVRRASNFSLSKPARETLFTVVSRDEKYKAKAGIDTFVYRGGDTVGTLTDEWLARLAVPVAAVAVPLGAVGVGLSLWLGRREREKNERIGDGPGSGHDRVSERDRRYSAGHAP